MKEYSAYIFIYAAVVDTIIFHFSFYIRVSVKILYRPSLLL